MVRLIKHLWMSATYMTAASIAARAFAYFAPVPFLNANFADPVVALWFVFLTFQSFVAVLNGTLPTVFVNMVAYAAAGSTSLGGLMTDAHKGAGKGEPNWELLRTICRLLVRVFGSLLLLWLLACATIGAALVAGPIGKSQLGMTAWSAWFVFAVATSFRFAQQGYISYLLALGKIADVRRLEAFAWLAGGLAAAGVLAFRADFLGAMICVQLPIIANFFVLGRLAKRHGWSTVGDSSKDVHLITSEVLPRAWRGSVGVLASGGAIYGSGLYFAQVGASDLVAAYLFALTIMGIVTQLAVSAFAASLPMMARLWAQSNEDALRLVARTALTKSMWAYVGLAIAVPIAFATTDYLAPGSLNFASLEVWLALSIANLLMRYGALHLQFYTITNDIRWHIFDVINSALFVCILVVSFTGDVMAFPISQAIALVLFYVPFARYLTYRRFGFGLRNEWATLLGPAMVLVGILGVWGVASA